MKKKFTIGQSNEIIQSGRIFELYNRYLFAGVEIYSHKSLRIHFEPDCEFGQGEPSISIEFKEITFLEFSEGFGTREVSSIAELGYVNPLERCDDWLLTEPQAMSSDHFFLRLSLKDFIRVHARTACLIVGSDCEVES